MNIDIYNNELLNNSETRRNATREKRTTMEQRLAVLMRNGACYDSRIKEDYAGTKNHLSKKKQLAADKCGYSMRCLYSPAHQKGEWLRCIHDMVHLR